MQISEIRSRLIKRREQILEQRNSTNTSWHKLQEPEVEFEENAAKRYFAEIMMPFRSIIKKNLEKLAVTDIGKLAMALVDAATIVVGTPTVLAGPHPYAAYAAFLANALRPKVTFLSIVGSYGWGGKTVETLGGMIPNLKVEILDPVLCKAENGYQ